MVFALVTGVYPGEKKSKAGANGRSSRAKVSGKLADVAQGSDTKTSLDDSTDVAPVAVADVTPAAISTLNEATEQNWASRLLNTEIAAVDRAEVDFDATAYSLTGMTASGFTARKGMIAADPRVLPLGTVVLIRAGSYSGTYCVMDTGGRIRGHKIDIFVPNRREALGFGRRAVRLKVLGRASSARAISALEKQDQTAGKKAEIN
ncbi:MAG TPA: 3D domain-containing protein [Blastocatellia bacterium]